MNVRIEELGRQQTPEGTCPLCRQGMDQHTVTTEETGLGRPRSVRPTGWACPRRFVRQEGWEPLEELAAIRHELEVTGELHDRLGARLRELGEVIGHSGPSASSGEPHSAPLHPRT